MRIYNNIRKIATGKGDDYSTGCLLDYNYFNNFYKMISIDLSKQQGLDADPKAIQQLNFTENLEQKVQQCFSLFKNQKKPFYIYVSLETVKVL